MSVECEEVRKIQNNHSIKSEEIKEMILEVVPNYIKKGI